MQDLDKFKNEMNLSGKNVYVGHRYVPKLDGDWDKTKTYEPLTIVQVEGNSFTSRQFVPTGVDINNKDYWVATGNYNAQIEYYRQDVVGVKDDLVELNNHVDSELQRVETNLDTKLDTGLQDISNTVDDKFESLENYIVSITQFGAVYNDPTFDNMPIIAMAQEYVLQNSPNKKGKIYFPAGFGDLYVKPLLKLKSGIELVGHVSRPVIKICPDVKDFYMLFGIEHTVHNAITNLTIDCNFENRTGYDISTNPQILIQTTNADYVTIEDNTLIGNGVWVFASFTSNVSDYSRYIKFNRNHVIWKAGLSTDKMGGFGADVDNTTIYFDALNYEMRDNVIETKDGVKNVTCIEMHGAYAILDNNIIKGFRTGLIVWSLVGNSNKSAGITSNNLQVLNNKFINVEAGITCGATSNQEYGSFDLENVHILNNNILLAPSKFDRPSGRGLEINIKTNGRNIKVKNNIVESLPNTRKFTDSATVYNFTGLSINGGNLSAIEVVGNTFKNITGVAMLISAAADSPVILSDSIIEDNLIIDAGRGGNIDFDGYQHRTAITVVRNARTSLVRTKIGVNHIRDTKETGAYFTRPVDGLITQDDDQDIISSKGSWSGKVTVPIKIQINGGTNEYIRPTTDSSREVVIEKNEVHISHTIWIDKTYTGDNVYMHLPISANIGDYNWYNGYYGYYDSATGTTTTGTMLINTERTNIAWFGIPNLKGSTLKKNDYIWFDFKYPIDTMAKYRL